MTILVGDIPLFLSKTQDCIPVPEVLKVCYKGARWSSLWGLVEKVSLLKVLIKGFSKKVEGSGPSDPSGEPKKVQVAASSSILKIILLLSKLMYLLLDDFCCVLHGVEDVFG